MEDDAHLIAKAVFGHHIPRDAGGDLDIAHGAGRDLVPAKDQFFRHPTAHANVHHGQHGLVRLAGLVALRQRRHHPQRRSAGHDGGLVDGVGPVRQDGHDGVPGLVEGRAAGRLGRDDGRLPLGAHHDLVLGVLQHGHVDGGQSVDGRLEGGLVHQIEQIGAGKSRRAAGQHVQIDVGRQFGLLGVHFQYLLPSADVRQGDGNVLIEPSRPEQGRVERFHKVGRPDHDDPVVLVEPVQLHQQFVERHLQCRLVLQLARPADGVRSRR